MKKIVYVFSAVLLFSLASCVTADRNSNQSVSGSDSKSSAIENILNRKSVRKYSDKAVEQDKIDTIVKCAMSAPR